MPRVTTWLSWVALIALILNLTLHVQSEESNSHWRIERFAGTGKAGYSGDGGPAIQAQLDNPYGIVRGPEGSLYICDMNNHAIRKISRDGIISTVAERGRSRDYSECGGAARRAR